MQDGCWLTIRYREQARSHLVVFQAFINRFNAMNSSTTTAKAPSEIVPPVRKSRLANPGWFLVSPSVGLLLLWMIVPLGMTVYFSLIRYNLLYPGENEFVGMENFTYFLKIGRASCRERVCKYV